MAEKEPLKWLESVKHRAEELRAEEEQVKQQIRAGFVDRAIIFMDVVGSTAFKQEHAREPEVWILRVRQFSELMAAAVLGCNGRVVKFIGDEVMAAFVNVYDALNLVARIDEIEKNLSQATGYETRIKVAADYGKVYILNFPGHTEPDPQGPLWIGVLESLLTDKGGKSLRAQILPRKPQNLDGIRRVQSN